MIDDPLRFKSVDVSGNRAGPALLIKISATVAALNRRDEINRLWNDWLAPNTEYRLMRSVEIVPLDSLKLKSVT